MNPAMNRLARLAGALYVLQMATGVFGFYARGQVILRGDVAQTAENMIAAERLFRVSVAAELVTCILVITLTWALYVLLRPVNQNLVFLAVFLRLVELAVLAGVTVSSLIALRLVSGADYLQAFDSSQLHSMMRLADAGHGMGVSIGFIFLGLGSAIFAYLLLKSRFIPRALGVWGIFSSLVLATVTLLIIVFPEVSRTVGLSYMMPMGIYEVSAGLWLLSMGTGRAGRGGQH